MFLCLQSSLRPNSRQIAYTVLHTYLNILLIHEGSKYPVLKCPSQNSQYIKKTMVTNPNVIPISYATTYCSLCVKKMKCT